MISSRHSGLDSLSSEQTQQTSVPFNNHRSTNSVRRQSRLLYAEKYGLNSPGWQNSTSLDTLEKGNIDHSSATTTDEDEEDDRPLSLQPRSYSYSAAMSSRRPRSIFNLSEPSATATRPTAFVKPITATASGSPPSTVPSDMVSIQQLYEQYHNKIYMEGFVFKRNKCNSDGTLCQDQWTKLYVELSGPVLSLWDGRKLNSNSTTILPQYINISDATVGFTSSKDNSTVIILNTAGRNEYHIRPDPPTLATAQRWMIAIRLSCFECARLFELYSRQLLLRPTYNHLWNATTSTTKQQQQRRRTEGFIQARFAGDTEWKKYWTVASDQRDQKRLFGKNKSVPCRGQIMFYESKKSKYPSVTLVNIIYAYTLYPQSPQLIDLAPMFKIEGTTLTTTDLKTGEQNMTHASAGTLLMAPSAKEMMQWLVGIFDVFKLYGRPSLLLDDPLDPKALNFGETATTTNNNGNTRLFLEYSDVMHLSIGQDETLVDTKLAFARILTEKMKSRSTNTPPANSSGYTAKYRSNSAPLLSNIAPPADYTMNQLAPSASNPTSATSIATIPNQPMQPSQRRRSYGPPMVYASDGSDDENDTSNNDSDEDDLNDNHSDTLSEFIATNNLLRLPYGEKELQSSSTSTTDSNKVLSAKDEEQDSNSTTDIMGFANSLLSKTFGTDSTNTSPTTTTSFKKVTPTIDTNVLPRSSPQSASRSSSSENMSPMQAAAPRTATIVDSTTPPTSATYNERPTIANTKRISVLPLPSDDEEEEDDDGGDGASKSTEDDDDSPLRSHALNKTTNPLSNGRPLSTTLSATTTPTTTASTRFSATTSSDGSSSNTSTSSQNQHHRKSKRQSILSQQPASNLRPSSSLGLVHKIDTMQQEIQLQQQQQQLEKEQQSLWETGSLMGTDPRIASYQYRPNQQQQQQLPPQQPAWDTRSMTGSVGGPDPRIAMYRQAGSMYGGGSLYRGNDGTGDSVYSGADDYQKMMGQPLVQFESKPSEPRSGLVGVISQLEDDKRENESNNNNNNRFSTAFSLQQQQQYQEQFLYQQQLLQQQQMMMNNPYLMNQMMMNSMMMNPMMMNPMMMNPMMGNPMMMMQQQPQPTPPQPKSRTSMYYSGSVYSNQQPLMEEDDEEDDDAPLARSDATPRNRRKSSGRF